MSTQQIQFHGRFIAYGAGSWSQGQYYEGDKDHWKDADVPERTSQYATWTPNPDRPTYDDWLFDGHDADGGFWVDPVSQIEIGE